MSAFFQKVGSSLEMYIVKENISDSPVYNIFELHKVQVLFTTSKTKLHTEYNELGTSVVVRVTK